MEPLSGAAAAAAAAGGGGASRPPSFASQTNALLRKNLIFQKRNRKATIRLIIVPIYLCVLLSVLQRVINNLLDKPKYKCGCMCVDVNGTGPCQNVCGIQYSTLDQAGSCPIPNPPEWPALLQVPRPEYRAIQDSSESCRKSQSCPAAIPFTGANETLSTTVMQNMFTDLPLLNISDNASISGLLLGTDMPGTSTGFIEPAFISDLPIYVLQSECKSRDSVTLRTTIDAINVQKEIKCVQGLPLWRNSSRTINEETFKGYRKGKIGKGISEVAMAYDFQDSNEKRFNVLALYNSTYQNISYVPMPFGLLRVSRSLNAVSNAYLQFLQGQGSGIKMLLEFTKEMPKQATRLTIDFSSLIGPLFFEWVVALLFPVMLTYLVYEKQHKLRTMMKMHGLGNGPYWIIYYAYFLILSTVYLVLFVIFGALIGLNFFKTNDYGIQFVFFFSFINLQIVLSFLAATFFSKVNTAQAIAYLYIFGSGLMAGSLIRNFLEGGKFPRHWITVLEIIPAFSLYRGLYELSQYAIRASETGNPGIQWSDLNDHTNGMRDVMIIIIVEWLVLLPVAYYFDYAASVGNSSGLLSIIKRLLRKNPTWRRIAVNEVADNDVHVEMEKLDIIKERETVDQVLQQRNSGYAVVCDDLKKVYHGKDGNPDKYAVRGLSLALPYGECLGILGPNGAGKSSFISMMIGFSKPTSGNAFVQDFSIHTDMENIYNSMGVCPQNDMLWEMLTGREHLQFYGRLKSLSGSALDLAVEESLRSVNLLLGGAADKQVRKYSGGMKRRLSIAISLIGDAKVVYMDEPSTGLDPASRKSLWTAVKQAKQDRAIILTTHSMEEAEVLCDRLCIMVDGRLQCIGRPKELIARYGGYYVLTMTTSSEFEREVEDLALKLLPNARKVYHLSGTQKYELSKQQVRIADVFMAVENLKRRVEVQAWGLADTTMEDVFVKVATGAQSSDELS
ncbi:ABC transporter A family member 8 isoform X2 [Aegilops tauschii subsp. strangulata]|uniref:ABC transporter domain-containing protein n=4 Tax=Triticinae TaxID=1648030 RepID=A0A3B6TUH2_WHEAT|nr:ABC transporter A family member 8 [Aegilops tauschii subsp. strangulata]XP_044442196.1 ABC transporter A family member 8-like isoform X3 [Triticum aestivum]